MVGGELILSFLYNRVVAIFKKVGYNNNINGTRCGRKLAINRKLFLYSKIKKYNLQPNKNNKE